METFNRVCSPGKSDESAAKARELLYQLQFVDGETGEKVRVLDILESINSGESIPDSVPELLVLLEKTRGMIMSLYSQLDRDLWKCGLTVLLWKTNYLLRCLAVTHQPKERLAELHIQSRIAILFSNPQDREEFWNFLTLEVPQMSFWKYTKAKEHLRLDQTMAAFNDWLGDEMQWGDTCFDLEALLKTRNIRDMKVDFEAYIQESYGASGQICVEY